MSQSKRIDELIEALVAMNSAAAEAAAAAAIAEGVGAREIVSEALRPAMEVIGSKFEEGEFFLPELLLGARATQKILEIVRPRLSKGDVASSGRVLIGTVEGDVHDIGKNIVVAVLEGEGFEVHDLGEDVAVPVFVEKAKALDPDVIGISALISIAVSNIGETVAALRRAGVSAPIIVGGAAVSTESASAMGADAYGKDAWDGARRVHELSGARN